MKVLLVEDDPKLGPLLRRALEIERHETTLVSSFEAARAYDPAGTDLAVVDWMLPDGDGLRLCASYRRDGFDAPILMLTCRGDTEDRVKALDAGVDDYLTKPFAMDELLARVRALGRRNLRREGLDAGALHVDVTRRNVFVDGRLLPPFTSTELDVLVYFVRRPNRVVSRAEILAAVWDGEEAASNVVQVAISRLRDKLQGFAPMLETVRGEVYRLRVPPAR